MRSINTDLFEQVAKLYPKAYSDFKKFIEHIQAETGCYIDNSSGDPVQFEHWAFEFQEKVLRIYLANALDMPNVIEGIMKQRKELQDTILIQFSAVETVLNR